MRKLRPITPGELLLEEFLKPLGISQYRLAKEVGVPSQRIGEIVLGRRSITADTDLRLCRFFRLSNGYWLRAQAAHDAEVAERVIGPKLVSIKPWVSPVARQRNFGTARRGVRSARYLKPHGAGEPAPLQIARARTRSRRR